MRLTNHFSVMGRKYDLAYGQANTWKRKLKNDKYELIENAIDKLGQYEDIDESPEQLVKTKKALEIIKGFVDFNVYEMQGKYYLTTGNNYRGQILISKEEYELLKEVLL